MCLPFTKELNQEIADTNPHTVLKNPQETQLSFNSSNFSLPNYLFLLVNNAYGIQSSKCMSILEEAGRLDKGRRVDAFVQSTDKNLMVPVGGSIIAGFDEYFVKKVSATYPGRHLLKSFHILIIEKVQGRTFRRQNNI